MQGGDHKEGPSSQLLKDALINTRQHEAFLRVILVSINQFHIYKYTKISHSNTFVFKCCFFNLNGKFDHAHKLIILDRDIHVLKYYMNVCCILDRDIHVLKYYLNVC